MNKHIISALIAVALVPFALAPAHAANGDDPCVTVSKSDVAAALGSPVATAKPSPYGLANKCSYTGSGALSLVEVVAYRSNDTAEAKKAYDLLTARMEQSNPGSAPVAGLGDAAVNIRTTIYVRKGTAMYTFFVNGRPGPETLAKVTALAKGTMPHVKA